MTVHNDNNRWLIELWKKDQRGKQLQCRQLIFFFASSFDSFIGQTRSECKRKTKKKHTHITYSAPLRITMTPLDEFMKRTLPEMEMRTTHFPSFSRIFLSVFGKRLCQIYISASPPPTLHIACVFFPYFFADSLSSSSSSTTTAAACWPYIADISPLFGNLSLSQPTKGMVCISI